MSDEKFFVGIKVLLLNEHNHIAVVRTSVEDAWELPGGHMSGKETVAETLTRELREEIGIQEFALEKLVYAERSRSDQLMLLFITARTTTDSWRIALSEEHREFKWVSVEDARKMVPKKFRDAEALNILVDIHKADDTYRSKNIHDK